MDEMSLFALMFPILDGLPDKASIDFAELGGFMSRWQAEGGAQDCSPSYVGKVLMFIFISAFAGGLSYRSE